MKKLLLVLLISGLLLLSSCSAYTYDDIKEMRTSWEDEYRELEAKYYDASDKAERLSSAMASLYEEFLVLYVYHDEADPDISAGDAHHAVMNMCKIFDDCGFW